MRLTEEACTPKASMLGYFANVRLVHARLVTRLIIDDGPFRREQRNRA